MVNKVTLIGNLGNDPELRRLESGAAVAQVSIATSENYKDKSGQWQSQTEWHDVVLWRTLAERAETQLKKGTLIYLEGKLSTRKWQDKDGNPRRKTEVVGSYFRVIKGREEVKAIGSLEDLSSSGQEGDKKQSNDSSEEEEALPF